VTGSDDGRREVRPLFEAMFETRFMLDLAEDTDAVFRRFTDVLVPAFADFVAVFLLDDDGTHVDLVVHAHRDPMAAEHLEVIRRLSTTDPTLPEARVAASDSPNQTSSRVKGAESDERASTNEPKLRPSASNGLTSIDSGAAASR
jgi:hypothetical protein